MNEKDIITELERTPVRDMEAPEFKRSLRHALVRMHGTRPSWRVRLNGLSNILTMKQPLTMVAGGMLAIALVLGAVTLPAGSSSVAEAQEQLQKSFTRAKQITPEMRAKIEAHMKADLFDTLDEAKRAPDLRILTEEQFKAESPFTISEGPQGGSIMKRDFVFNEEVDPAMKKGVGVAGVTSVFHGTVNEGEAPAKPVKYLVYTNAQGGTVYLGLDETDTPVMKIMEMNFKEGDVIKLPDGQIGLPAVGAFKIRQHGGEPIEAGTFEVHEDVVTE